MHHSTGDPSACLWECAHVCTSSMHAGACRLRMLCGDACIADTACSRSRSPGRRYSGSRSACLKTARRRAPVPAQMWQRRAPVPAQMWQRRAQSRRRCGSGEPSPGADVAAAKSVTGRNAALVRSPLPQVVLVPYNTADGEHTSVLRKANKAEARRPALEPSPPQHPACDVRRATRSVRHAMQSVHAPAYKRADPSRAGERQGDSPHAPDTMRRAAGFARACKGLQRAIVRGCNVRL
jgi:hypothetical protein